MRACLATILASFLFVFGVAVTASAHEGHDHAKEAPSVGTALPRGSATSDEFELVVILRDGELRIFLDRFITNEPVANAKIEAETPNGPALAVAMDDGTYRLVAPWAKSEGQYDLIFTVSAGERIEILPLSIKISAQNRIKPLSQNSWLPILTAALALLGLAVFILRGNHWRRIAARFAPALVAFLFLVNAGPSHSHEGEDHGNQQAGDSRNSRDIPQRLPDGSLFVPKTTQRLLAVRTAITSTEDHFKSIELPGRIIPDPNASGYVQSALAGRLSPPPKGFPTLGTRIEKGELLAYVTPPIQAIDVSDMRQKDGELLQQISIVERRVVRFEQLIKSGAISKTQLEEAKLELNGLLERRTALEQTRREPEALIAPVSGVIAAANTVAGQLAQPNTVIFEIIDSSRLWVEALTFDPIASTTNSSARLSNGRSIKLTYRGAGFAGRNQAIPVHFAVVDSPEGLWAGQFVTVYASGTEKYRGIAVPRSAVVRASNGQLVIYDHTAAERFEAREVRVAPLDSERVLVLSGLSEGQRIVTQGAELIDQVR